MAARCTVGKVQDDSKVQIATKI